MTKAQRRAFDWLPADGSWRVSAGHKIAPALNSLSCHFRAYVESDWGAYGPRGGFCLAWRLTPEGTAAKAMGVPFGPA